MRSSSKLKSPTPDRGETSDVNIKKPPLPTTLTRKNSLSHRYSWNRIHLNDLFSLSRLDTVQNKEATRRTSREATPISSPRATSPGLLKPSSSKLNVDLTSASSLARTSSFKNFSADRKTSTPTTSRIGSNKLSTSNLSGLRRQCKLRTHLSSHTRQLMFSSF
jgi:hypothetical protein